MNARVRRLGGVLASALLLVAAALSLDLGGGTTAAASTSGPTATIYLQTMDSCQSAIGGASYQLTGNGVDQRVKTKSATKRTVTSGTGCPLQQGNCKSISTGCTKFTKVPPGTYRIHETKTPKGDSVNTQGYAACNGGSACQSQVVNLTVSSTGAVQATVTNVYPDGTSVTYPTASGHGGAAAYAGTKADPIVVHNFGLAPPSSNKAMQCDGDGDADDHLTGTPSSDCAYPEGQEASACQPYPWSCTLGFWPSKP